MPEREGRAAHISEESLVMGEEQRAALSSRAKLPTRCFASATMIAAADCVLLDMVFFTPAIGNTFEPFSPPAAIPPHRALSGSSLQPSRPQTPLGIYG